MSQYEVSEAALAAAARLLGRRVGLRPDPAIRGRLSRCVADEAASRNLAASDYVSRLEDDQGLFQGLLDRVTVQETAFFRDAAQFDALAGIIPDLTAPVTVWSAGCSNGQEPYSLAMAFADAGMADARVIATDVSSRAIARTDRAVYSEREIAGVGDDRRRRYFTRSGSEWQASPQLRARVDVMHHNLVADPPPFAPGACQLIFCRNVLIYLRPDDVLTFLERLSTWMHPSGWLFLGYSESLWHVTDRFQLVRVADAFAYRRSGASPATPPRAERQVAAATRPPRAARVSRRASEPLAASPSAGRARVPDAGAPTVVELLAEGEAAMNVPDVTRAVAIFRKAVYLDPDQPVGHLHLGFALEGAGQPVHARRAYAAALGCLGSSTAAVETVLEGYDVDELVRLLEAKLSELPTSGSR